MTRKLDPNIIRVGDVVRIVTPKLVVRVGYPREVSSYIEQARSAVAGYAVAAIGKVNPSYASKAHLDKLIREMAYLLAKADGFGGSERSVHETAELPHLAGTEFRVQGIEYKKTGTYFPPTYSGGGWDDYADWEPGGLGDEKTVKILCGWFAGDLRAFRDIDKPDRILAERVTKVMS